MAKIGDTVRFLNSVGGGRIVRLDDRMAYVEDADGFEIPVLLKECVVVMNAEDAAPPKPKAPEYGKPHSSAAMPPSKEVVPPPAAPLPPVVETPEGEKLNIVVGFLADNLKALSGTTYTAELVNDSNYYLAFVLLARADNEAKWRLIKGATVEPDTVMTLCTLEPSDIQTMDRLALQYVAFKVDKPFDIKAPQSVEIKVDTTKFFKFHCFRDNTYFDDPVIAVEFVRDDRPNRPITIDPERLAEVVKTKKAAEQRPVRPVRKRTPRTPDILEVDLHIGELTDTTRGLSNADMLNLQIDEFRKVMDANLKNHGRKIVFIHGKGEGVLRQAIMKELNHRYKGHDVQDASFREYGFGATQVTIR